MGEKKKKEASAKMWTKVIAVIAGVLFVVLMVVSAMGTSWISSFATVKPGDSVVVDYTIYDVNGNPLITTDASQYNQAIKSGTGLIFAKQITLAANQSWPGNVYPVQIYTTRNGWSQQFAIFSSEDNAISSGVVGMKANEKKRISFPGNSMLTDFFPEASLQHNNVNISELSVGETLAMAVSDTRQLAVANASSAYIRFGQVTQVITAGNRTGVSVDFGYPAADITVTSINSH